MKPLKEINLLLVDDSPEDIQLTKLALRQANIPAKISVAYDGIECLKLLHACMESEDKLLPDLILLDLNMPRKDGKEVLEELKRDPALKTIPVIILTTSQSDKDILESYERYANSYVSKPLNFHEFGDVMAVIEKFWLQLVRLPEKSTGKSSS